MRHNRKYQFSRGNRAMTIEIARNAIDANDTGHRRNKGTIRDNRSTNGTVNGFRNRRCIIEI